MIVSLGVGITVCAGVVGLVGILFVGVLCRSRIFQGACSKQSEEKQEMEWDNSALNVVVNPMSDEILYGEDICPQKQHQCQEDASEDEAAGTSKNKELEWDDSTLTF